MLSTSFSRTPIPTTGKENQGMGEHVCIYMYVYMYMYVYTYMYMRNIYVCINKGQLLAASGGRELIVNKPDKPEGEVEDQA